MIRFAPALCFIPMSAMADVPTVVTDIAALHSITANVMGDLGTPAALLPPGADPHDFALRPSDAGRLGDAEIVFWVGESLTPWLKEPLETLAPQAVHFSMLDTPNWTPLNIRELATFGAHHDDHDDHGHDDHGHKDEHADHDDHGHDHDHDHGDFDPHAWLDPDVAGVWAQTIAQELGRLDPANAATYQTNADTVVADLAALTDGISAQLSGLSGQIYVLPHDGYQYFEARFGLTASAAVAGIDARTPGPAQVAQLRAQLAEQDVACVFSDAEIGENWARVITEGTTAKTVQIDGVGVGLTEGPALYAQLITRLADNFAQCLTADS